VAGDSSDGLSSATLPAARAPINGSSSSLMGKFHALMMRTTPLGSGRMNDRPSAQSCLAGRSAVHISRLARAMSMFGTPKSSPMTRVLPPPRSDSSALTIASVLSSYSRRRLPSAPRRHASERVTPLSYVRRSSATTSCMIPVKGRSPFWHLSTFPFGTFIQLYSCIAPGQQAAHLGWGRRVRRAVGLAQPRLPQGAMLKWALGDLASFMYLVLTDMRTARAGSVHFGSTMTAEEQEIESSLHAVRSTSSRSVLPRSSRAPPCSRCFLPAVRLP
jgi:hypothetical protein